MTEMKNIILVFVVLTLAQAVRAGADDPFSIVVIPDSQIAVMNDVQRKKEKSRQIFETQLRWIVENKTDLNIKHVIHVGDIVQHADSKPEWNVVDGAVDLLNGVVPFSMAPGNHDIDKKGRVRNTVNFNTVFDFQEISRFQNSLNIMPGDPRLGRAQYQNLNDPMDNSFSTFSAGGAKWLVLALEWNPRNVVMKWADQVVKSHPDHNVLLATHAYLYNDNTHLSHNAGHKYAPAGSDGLKIWNDLVRPNPNIRFVFSGHVLGDGNGRRSDFNQAGRLVYQMLANYQNKKLGGAGFLRLLKFFPARNMVQVETLSPYLEKRPLAFAKRYGYHGSKMKNAANWFDLTQAFDLFKPSRTRSPKPFVEEFASDEGFRRRWHISSRFFQGKEGAKKADWSVKNGSLVQSSNVYGFGIDGDNRLGTYVVRKNRGNQKWQNYRFSASLRNSDNDGLGLLFYFSDEFNYYKLEMDHQRNFLRVYRISGGIPTRLASVPFQYPLKKWFKASVQIRGEDLIVSVDGLENNVIVSDPELSQRYGTVGLYSWGSSGVRFDNVNVQ